VISIVRRKNDDFMLVKGAEDENVYILSKKLKERWFNYLWQSAAAGLITFIVLYIFLELIQLIILAGVGSTFFTIFALPGNRTASDRNIIGSYIICVTVGLFCIYTISHSIGGGLAVGLSTLFMVITDTEHPPAAGVALGLSLAPNLDSAYPGAGFALAGALLAVIIRNLLAPYLKNLV
jgi:CBS-domain-containing membrane protein